MRVAFAAAVGASIVSGNARISGCNDVPDRAVVSWSMPDGPGAKGVVFEGCSDWSVRGMDSKVSLGLGSDDCTIQGWRQDGLLTVRSYPVDLGWLSQGEVAHVAFDGMPRGTIAGIGAELRASGDQIRIVRVLDDGPAARAGLHANQEIISVNGVPTVETDVWDAVRLITGAPGSEVRLIVRDDSGEYILMDAEIIVRAPIR